MKTLPVYHVHYHNLRSAPILQLAAFSAVRFSLCSRLVSCPNFPFTAFSGVTIRAIRQRAFISGVGHCNPHKCGSRAVLFRNSGSTKEGHTLLYNNELYLKGGGGGGGAVDGIATGRRAGRTGIPILS